MAAMLFEGHWKDFISPIFSSTLSTLPEILACIALR